MKIKLFEEYNKESDSNVVCDPSCLSEVKEKYPNAEGFNANSTMISRIKELSSENNSETLVVIDDTKAEQKFIDERISFIKGFVNTKNYKIIKLSEL